ncbi:polysaccharide deacetylase family protein [Schleiferiaceae bacterium]|nr:polysaccharide deacetylase family protein [Schleiferiaceae bacterium]
MKNGIFIISLDLELFWGVRDVTDLEAYGESILGVRTSFPKTINLLDEYKVCATIASVGLLFFEEKSTLMKELPSLKPKYVDEDLSPYPTLENIGKNEEVDKFHFGKELISCVSSNHEIATHTFSHYYCLEPGQNKDEFEQDLVGALNIMKKCGLKCTSIVFPRNQINPDYLDVCARNGIIAYRGNPKSWIYRASEARQESLIKRFLRLLDSYINITGRNIYGIENLTQHGLINIPGSAFLRPYNSRLHLLEKLKVYRIKRSMLMAAKKNKIYHLWWHPHNFGLNQEKNIQLLTNILEYYKELNKLYKFQSSTISDTAEVILKLKTKDVRN